MLSKIIDPVGFISKTGYNNHFTNKVIVTRTICSLLLGLLFHPLWAQQSVLALDSMGANMGAKNWKRASFWALKAAEAVPEEKYWRYMNAAEFASLDSNATLTFAYLSKVVDSDIALQVYYKSKAFEWLHTDVRWKSLMEKVQGLKKAQQVKLLEGGKQFAGLQKKLLEKTAYRIDSLDKQANSPQELYNQLINFSHVGSKPISGQYQYGWLPLSDSLQAPFIIQLPPGFDYTISYPLIVVLHGAIGMQLTFDEVPDSTMTFFGKMFKQKAADHQMIALLPLSTKQYNWMMPDDGFHIVPEMIREVKRMYNINDAKVYITGHSNGATGSFSYLMKNPSPFAAFSGINNKPQVRTGGTFLKNALNRPFYNVSTQYDYYFPLPGHKKLEAITKELGIEWQNHLVGKELEHGYLITGKDTLTKKVYEALFRDMQSKIRNPFGQKIYWECDDVKYGRCDWLAISQLDTLAGAEGWHKKINFEVTGWRSSQEPEQIIDSLSMAFTFPRLSGVVEATYENNTFTLQTSRVKSLILYLSPQMVDMQKPITVIINGKRVFRKKVSINKHYMLKEFLNGHDRQALWVEALTINMPQKGRVQNKKFGSKHNY